MASPTVAATNESFQPNASTPHVVNLPAGISSGDLLIVIMDKGSSTATAMNALTGWTELLDEVSTNGLFIAWRTADGTEGTTATFTSATGTRTAEMSFLITGAADPAITPPEIGTTSTGTSVNPDPPAVTPTGGSKDYLFITFAGLAGEEADDDTWATASPTNYTPSPPLMKTGGTTSVNFGGKLVAAYRQLTASTDDPGTFTVQVSAAWRAQTIAIHPSGAAPPAIPPELVMALMRR